MIAINCQIQTTLIWVSSIYFESLNLLNQISWKHAHRQLFVKLDCRCADQKIVYSWISPKIMITCCQITCTILWLSCEQLPYPPEHPRISRIRQRDKLEIPLLTSTYKYLLPQHSFPTLPSSIPRFIFWRRHWWGTQELEQQRTFPESSSLWLLFV